MVVVNQWVLCYALSMQRGFWDTLPRPFFCLAPMANVTDAAFRRVITHYGKPDVLWTEFVSADGLQSSGREKLLIDLLFEGKERPIVAQIFGARPETVEKSSALIMELGFDGIDINMGCPDRAIEKQGAGAALIKNPTLAKELIEAARQGVKDTIPVSVKTRTGYNKNIVEEWIGHLLLARPAAITLHARTRKDMSQVPADWESVRRAVTVATGTGTRIIGNGDVETVQNAREKAREYGCDGVMLGRGIFGNPWLFANRACAKHNCPIERPPKLLAKADCDCLSVEKILLVMVEHARTFEALLGEHKSFSIMRKHFGAYVRGFAGASEVREKLMKTENADEVRILVERLLIK